MSRCIFRFHTDGNPPASHGLSEGSLFKAAYREDTAEGHSKMATRVWKVEKVIGGDAVLATELGFSTMVIAEEMAVRH